MRWWLTSAALVLLAICAARLRSNLLEHAAITGNLPLAQISLAMGADPAALCSMDEWVEVAESMAGFRLHQVNRMPVLLAAALNKHPSAVRVLLNFGADPNGRDDCGATALLWAAGNGDRESVRLLLAAGANPSARWKDGSPILGNLPSRPDAQIVAMLKQAGAAD